MQITINDVRDAVHAAIEAAFQDIPVYSEEIEQGLSPPNFLVRLLKSTIDQELGRRYKRHHPFDVQYVPTAGNEEMYDVAEQLVSVLQLIEVAGRPVRGTKMQFEVVNGVLHFYVDYDVHVAAPKSSDPAMASLDVQGGLK